MKFSISTYFVEVEGVRMIHLIQGPRRSGRTTLLLSEIRQTVADLRDDEAVLILTVNEPSRRRLCERLDLEHNERVHVGCYTGYSAHLPTFNYGFIDEAEFVPTVEGIAKDRKFDHLWLCCLSQANERNFDHPQPSDNFASVMDLAIDEVITLSRIAPSRQHRELVRGLVWAQVEN